MPDKALIMFFCVNLIVLGIFHELLGSFMNCAIRSYLRTIVQNCTITKYMILLNLDVADSLPIGQVGIKIYLPGMKIYLSCIV